jgi:hypothetical protein
LEESEVTIIPVLDICYVLILPQNLQPFMPLAFIPLGSAPEDRYFKIIVILHQLVHL